MGIALRPLSSQRSDSPTCCMCEKDKACEESFISTNTLYNLLLSYLSVPLLPQLYNKLVVKSCSLKVLLIEPLYG